MKRNGNVERQKRENRGAEDAEGVMESGERVSPSPVGRSLGVLLPKKIFLSFCLAMVHFGTFWALVLMLV